MTLKKVTGGKNILTKISQPN